MKVYLIYCRDSLISIHQSLEGAKNWMREETVQYSRPEPLSWFDSSDGSVANLKYYSASTGYWIRTGYSVQTWAVEG